MVDSIRVNHNAEGELAGRLVWVDLGEHKAQTVRYNAIIIRTTMDSRHEM